MGAFQSMAPLYPAGGTMLSIAGNTGSSLGTSLVAVRLACSLAAISLSNGGTLAASATSAKPSSASVGWWPIISESSWMEIIATAWGKPKRASDLLSCFSAARAW